MAVLEELKHYAQSFLGNFPGKDAPVDPNTLLDLIRDTENVYKSSHPKSTFEKIMAWLQYGPTPLLPVIGELNRTRMALAEAVEWIQEARSFDGFCGDKAKVPLHEKAASSILAILAILEGERTRTIPKT